MQVKIYYEDTDLSGMVYHSNYLKFCERARSELFFKHHIIPINQQGQFVVHKINCEFKAAAKIGDMLEIQTKILCLKKASLELEQSIFLKNKLIFIAKINLAHVNNKGKVSPIDKKKLKIFSKL